MAKQTFSATIFFTPATNIPPRKYRKITNLERFYQFAQKIEYAIYCNVYLKIEVGKPYHGKASVYRFEHRKWLTDQFVANTIEHLN